MGFCHVTLTVKDLEASLRFYREVAGLPLDRRFPAGPDTEIAFLGDGQTKVELIWSKSAPAAVPGNGISIGFEVESAEALLSALNDRGIPVVSGIIQPNPHVKFFFATDPDGFRVQFLENI